MSTNAKITVVDLAGVVYSSGKVFDGLSTGRLDTENFLRSGSLDGVTSRSDLALLKDLRDVAQFVIDHVGDPIDGSYVCAVNATLTRSGALHPGDLRTADQAIGVNTRFGRHEPPALTDAGLQQLLDVSVQGRSPLEGALTLFVALAKAQPFEDGNKRTALFAANGLLLAANTGTLLSIPVDEHDPSVADRFNELLARAYIHGETSELKDMMRTQGVLQLDKDSLRPSPASDNRSRRLRTADPLDSTSTPLRSEPGPDLTP